MQRWRYPPHDVVAHEARQHEDRQPRNEKRLPGPLLHRGLSGKLVDAVRHLGKLRAELVRLVADRIAAHAAAPSLDAKAGCTIFPPCVRHTAFWISSSRLSLRLLLSLSNIGVMNARMLRANRAEASVAIALGRLAGP